MDTGFGFVYHRKERYFAMGNRVWIKVVVWATLISMIVSTLLMGVSFFGV